MPLDSAATVGIQLHQKQGVALQTPATEVLFGGAAGGGKSFLMRSAAIMWCGMIPGLQVYLFRRRRDDLLKNHIEGPQGLRQLLAPWVSAGFFNSHSASGRPFTKTTTSGRRLLRNAPPYGLLITAVGCSLRIMSLIEGSTFLSTFMSHQKPPSWP
jgi:hypothetical protein